MLPRSPEVALGGCWHNWPTWTTRFHLSPVLHSPAWAVKVKVARSGAGRAPPADAVVADGLLRVLRSELPAGAPVEVLESDDECECSSASSSTTSTATSATSSASSSSSSSGTLGSSSSSCVVLGEVGEVALRWLSCARRCGENRYCPSTFQLILYYCFLMFRLHIQSTTNTITSSSTTETPPQLPRLPTPQRSPLPLPQQLPPPTTTQPAHTTWHQHRNKVIMAVTVATMITMVPVATTVTMATMANGRWGRGFFHPVARHELFGIRGAAGIPVGAVVLPPAATPPQLKRTAPAGRRPCERRSRPVGCAVLSQLLHCRIGTRAYPEHILSIS